MVEEDHNHHSQHRIGSSSNVDCGSRDEHYKANKKRNIPTEKRPLKIKDFLRVYGHAITRLNRVTSFSFSPPKSSPSPPLSRSSKCDVAGSEEAQLALDIEDRVEIQRQLVEEVDNNTMNGIHSARYNPPDNPSTTSATTPNSFFKQKTKDDILRTITSPLSRITSRRSPSPSPRTSSSSSFSSSLSKSATRRSVSPLSTFVHKCITGRKSSSVDHDHSSPATAPSTLSRNNTTSTTSTNKASAASSLTRDVSRRSNASSATTTAPSPVFSRNPSERSTTPIMFSNSTGRKVKPPPVQKNLECTLEELFYGCTKKVKVTRDVLTDRGQIVKEEEILSIEVKPGWRKGTKVTFEGMGNERLGAEPADVTFVIAEKRHSLFRREGDDLEIAVEIPLVQALTGCDISIPLMSETGETMNLLIQDVISPGYKKVIPGQGMPKSKELNMRGNLKVTFLVEFPVELTEEQRSQVVSILKGSS